MKKIFLLFLIVLTLNVNGQFIRATFDSTYCTNCGDPQIGTLTKPSGVKYPLFLSIHGKIYYWKISQITGQKYKVYTRHPYYRY